MKVLGIVVNYRTADRAVRAIESLVTALEGMDGRITVVDNDSGDGSYEKLVRAVSERRWSRVEVIKARKNGGFGYGNNVAIRRAYDIEDPPDYFFLLNPDAVADADAVAALVEFMDENPKVGIAGSRILGFDGKPHTSAFRFPSPLGELESGLKLGLATRALSRWVVAPGHRKSSGAVDWVSGASFMIRRQVFERVGLFDEAFFLYFEEIDLCRRALEHGLSTWYVHESRVQHEGGVATGVNDGTRRPLPPYWFASRRRFYAKHHGIRTLLTADLLFTVGYSLFRVRRRIQRKADVDPPGLLQDFLRHSLLPEPLERRSAAPAVSR
jgi:GT2 family glycosyltransferase